MSKQAFTSHSHSKEDEQCAQNEGPKYVTELNHDAGLSRITLRVRSTYRRNGRSSRQSEQG
ncbi:hypothetical protein EYC08_20520 [Tabrizicola sp. WMC-M-20]|nr:hypothetical protein EYC08_20520 [Tabrizicola sp. WMC-M-20]